MSHVVGTVQEIFGSVIARDSEGKERMLQMGDDVHQNEIIITLNQSSDVMLSFENGRQLSLNGEDEVCLDDSVCSADSYEQDSLVVNTSLEESLILLENFDINNFEEVIENEVTEDSLHVNMEEVVETANSIENENPKVAMPQDTFVLDSIDEIEGSFDNESETHKDSLEVTSLDTTLTAYYSGSFDEYTITPSSTMKGYYIVTDTVSGRDGSDLIYKHDIDKLQFEDQCVNFKDVISEFEDDEKAIEEVYSQAFMSDNELQEVEDILEHEIEYTGAVSYFASQVDLENYVQSETIHAIKIHVKGYQQGEDYVLFDSSLVPLGVTYEYGVSEDEVSIIFNGKADVGAYTTLLASLNYENIASVATDGTRTILIDVDTNDQTIQVWESMIHVDGEKLLAETNLPFVVQEATSDEDLLNNLDEISAKNDEEQVLDDVPEIADMLPSKEDYIVDESSIASGEEVVSDSQNTHFDLSSPIDSSIPVEENIRIDL